MQSSLTITPSQPCPASKVSQVLNHNRSTGGNALDNSFRQNVVTIPAEAPLPTSHFFKVAFGRLCSFGLQSPFKSESSAVYFLAGSFAQKLSLGSNRRKGLCKGLKGIPC